MKKEKPDVPHDILSLERLLLFAWPARESETLHGWTLLTDGGFTGRANAATPLKFDGALGAAIIDVQKHYQSRHMRPIFRIARGACAPIDLPEALSARGWKPSMQTLVMVAPISAALATLPDPVNVTLGAAYPDTVDAILKETSATPAEYDERRGLAQRTPQPRVFALTGDDAAGLCVLVEGQAGIFLMRTHPAQRRKGHARRILAALLRWARDNGATDAFLQVEASNAPAIALYEAAAFKTVYSYDYWREEPSR